MGLELWHAWSVMRRWGVNAYLLTLLGACWLTSAVASSGQKAAPELVPQTAQSTALLDFRGENLQALNPELPPWIEDLQRLEASALPIETPYGVLLSLRERNEPSALLLRILYQASASLQLYVQAYDGEFRELIPREALPMHGEGMKSRYVWLPVEGIRYVAISSSEPRVLQTVLATMVRPSSQWMSEDLLVEGRPLTLFQTSFALSPSDQDLELFGRVRAELMPEEESLASSDSLEFEVALEKLPLLAVLSFRVSGIDPSQRLWVDINGRGPFSVHYNLPDLADPMYIGRLKQAASGMTFQYLAPVAAKAVIPENVLRLTEPNSIRIYLPKEHPDVTIFQIVLELKYPWPKFTYILEP